jgi:CheY-like chemotaxis protein
MRLQALVLCADEKILRVLRRVLSDLEIVLDHSAEGDDAIHKLTRQRYEAVIVDYANERVASQVLRSARSAPVNKRAVVVAILDADKAMRGAFDLGAHFVLYKPISTERARSSFRAARALMKCERRRNTRIPVEIPVTLEFEGGGQQKTVTSDLSEGGIAVLHAPRSKQPGPMTLSFTLPGTDYKVQCKAEMAWTNSSRQAGVRFVDPSPELGHQLKAWLDSHAPEIEQNDPPTPCKLTDLSPNCGYLETTAPFPVRTKVTLAMGASQIQVEVGGVVRVAHPEMGMGIEFAQNDTQQRERVEAFIQALIQGGSSAPEILVQPEGLEEGEASPPPANPHMEDPLLDLFRTKASLPTGAFLAQLRSQRSPAATA